MRNLRIWAGTVALLACSGAGAAGVYEDMVRAMELNDERAVAGLLKRGVDVDMVTPNGDTLLMVAAKEGKPGMVNTILGAKPKVNARNPYGETALMLAVFHGHAEIARQLIAQGAEVNHNGWNPLLYATARNRLDMARLLIGHGAKVNASATNGTTALMMASREGHLAMVLFLLEHGADFTLKNDDGDTALRLAQGKGWREIAETLGKAGARE